MKKLFFVISCIVCCFFLGLFIRNTEEELIAAAKLSSDWALQNNIKNVSCLEVSKFGEGMRCDGLLNGSPTVYYCTEKYCIWALNTNN